MTHPFNPVVWEACRLISEFEASLLKHSEIQDSPIRLKKKKKSELKLFCIGRHFTLLCLGQAVHTQKKTKYEGKDIIFKDALVCLMNPPHFLNSHLTTCVIKIITCVH